MARRLNGIKLTFVLTCMTKLSPYLFVYGTLMNQETEPALSLMKGCSFSSKGKFPGKLYDLGEYPGAVLSKAGEVCVVFGDVVVMHSPAETLKVLDEYEGFGYDQEQPNLFIRELVKIETVAGEIECWVYLYNLPIEGVRQIKSGRY